ncbi:hypothetical protein DFH08DRAFT_81780 [Mycena albidolilacea]|uniref:Uncharacterized protein n=1 Tax=Mycena albidolilacea TaxID=1033008 RepID=A0AAD7A8K9_9AGAR|nr:hypothetical protein DFH08DRAFT_81780 [Mycena albidolilacea]
METKTSSSRRIKLRASSSARLLAPAVHLRPILHCLLLQLHVRHHPAAARFLRIQGCTLHNSSSASIRLRRFTGYDGGEPRARRAWTAALSMRSAGLGWERDARQRTRGLLVPTATVHSPKPMVSYTLAPPPIEGRGFPEHDCAGGCRPTSLLA